MLILTSKEIMKEHHFNMHVYMVHLPIVEYLISKGANINVKDEYWKKTPLHYASGRGKADIIKYLISKGANKKYQRQRWQNTI